MTSLTTVAVRAFERLGDLFDTTASAIRVAPQRVREAATERRPRRYGAVAASVVLVVYLFSIGDLAISPAGKLAGAPLAQLAPENLFRARAPYLFEPVVAIRPDSHVTIFASPPNLLLGGIIAVLVGCNIVLASFAARRAACTRVGYGRLLSALPAFLLGFACCAPTVLLAVGGSATATLLPFLLPLRPIFYPLAVTLLLITLVWATHRSASPRSTTRTR